MHNSHGIRIRRDSNSGSILASSLMTMILHRHIHGILTLFLAAFLIPAGSLAASEQPSTAAIGGRWQSIESISAVAEAHARRSLGRHGLQVESRVKALDARLKLARCDQPLQGFLPPNAEIRRNVVVGVRCRGSNPWKVYVPVRLAAFREVLVAGRPLERGATLGSADIRKEKRDITIARGAYLTDASQIQGKVLRRSVPEGRMMTTDLLAEEEIIKRGQRVTLMVAQNGFTVRMAGTALTDGTVNERIQVKNDSSQRTVEGIVRSRQLVEVIAY